MIPSAPKARFLMCRPEHFGVTYSINPWMDPLSWAREDRALVTASRRQWAALYRALRNQGAAIELVPPAPGLPDLVFTANAAVVLDRKALLARFRYPERQRESVHFEAAFLGLQARGLIDTVKKLPDHLVLEGAGDCVWDETRNLFWMGYGPRSDAAARDAVKDVFGADVVALELADPRFYHLDTAFCPLARGEVLIVPGAFTPAGKAAIRERIPASQQIEVEIEDASELAANAVCLGDTIVMSRCGERLRGELAQRGYDVVTTALTAFLRSGGAAFCLTLRLDRRSVAAISLMKVPYLTRALA
jgi:N-dimethylarginine dimethylaminohydrolase